MKVTKIITLIIFVFLIAGGLLLVAMQRNESSPKTLEALTATVLKVGKADAIVLIEGDNCLVIDTGEEDDGEELCTFLTEQGVQKVNTLIITHFDKDHVGGADTLIERFRVDRILAPDYDGTVTDYMEFTSALKAAGLTAERLTSPVEFELGTAHVLVEPPNEYPDTSTALEVDNDCSLITTVTHGSNRLLFMGDAEKTRIRDWIDGGTAQQCDFMKLPHHGVYNTALSELFSITRPRHTAITSSAKNPADVKTLELIKTFSSSIYETKDGKITVISNGSTLEVKQKIKL